MLVQENSAQIMNQKIIDLPKKTSTVEEMDEMDIKFNFNKLQPTEGSKKEYNDLVINSYN